MNLGFMAKYCVKVKAKCMLSQNVRIVLAKMLLKTQKILLWEFNKKQSFHQESNPQFAHESKSHLLLI